MRAAGPGGGFGGMMGGMKGLQAGGIHSPNMDNLTDDSIVGKVYDHKVVVRLAGYIRPYKRDVLISLAAVLLYTVGNVSIPLLMMLGINWAINEGELWRLNVIGGAFVAVTVMHFLANYVQLVYMPKVGQGILRLPEEIQERCRQADIVSKSMLLQIVRQPDLEAMHSLIDRISGDGITREEARSLKRGSEDKTRPQSYTFRYEPEDEGFRFSLTFDKSRVERKEVIDTLQRILDDLGQPGQQLG